MALIDIPGSGVVAERKDDEPLLVLRQKTPEEKANSGSSVMEGIGAFRLVLRPSCRFVSRVFLSLM